MNTEISVPSPATIPDTTDTDSERRRRPCFITWLPHCRRSDMIADALHGRSHLVHHLAFERPAIAPLKYVLQALTTLRHLVRDRPPLVLVNTPPIVGPLVVWAWCAATGTPFVIDAHTGAFDDPRWRWALPLQRRLSRRALTTLVTSEHLAEQVRSWGARAEVVDTVPITFSPAGPAELGPGPHVMVVSTFSRDEPLQAVLDAAAETPEVTYHITGDRSRAGFAAGAVPSNVRLTGWISDADYHGLLQSADAVLSLTTRDHTMQHGGYEAMAAGKPFITSHWQILRDTFDAGTVHVDNSPQQIAAAVRTALADANTLRDEMRSLAARRDARFATTMQRLRTETGLVP